IPSHRFSPSVIDRLATSVYRIEAVATCHPIYSSLGTQSLNVLLAAEVHCKDEGLCCVLC
ncbi:MAG: hypothetical protein WBO88_19050, partial [Candidatus Dechloromonas phosphoritropha]